MSRPEILQHDLQDHHPTLSQRTPDLPSDHVIQLEFDIEEDIPGELEDFVLQSRLGAFRTAQELFEANLKPHLRFFPVVAEYADFLLEQQSFRQLLDFVLRLPPDADSSEDERGLLDLLFALSTLRTEGSLNKALSLARNWRSRTARPWKHFSEADIQALEIYLQIIVFAFSNSDLVTRQDSQPPWVSDEASLAPWEGFREWCATLMRNHRPWESHRIFRLLLTVIAEETAAGLFSEFRLLVDGEEDGEATTIAKLGAINAYSSFLLRLRNPSVQDNLSMATTLIREANDLLAHVFGTKNRTRGRLYNEWKLNMLKLSEVSFKFQPHDLFDQLESIYSNAEAEGDFLIQAVSRLRGCATDLSDASITPEGLERYLTVLSDLRKKPLQDPVGYAIWVQDFIDLVVHGKDPDWAILPVPNSQSVSMLSIVKDLIADSPVRESQFQIPSLIRRDCTSRLKLAELQLDENAAEQARRELASINNQPLGTLNSLFEHESGSNSSPSANEEQDNGAASKMAKLQELSQQLSPGSEMQFDSNPVNPNHPASSASVGVDPRPYSKAEKLTSEADTELTVLERKRYEYVRSQEPKGPHAINIAKTKAMRSAQDPDKFGKGDLSLMRTEPVILRQNQESASNRMDSWLNTEEDLQRSQPPPRFLGREPTFEVEQDDDSSSFHSSSEGSVWDSVYAMGQQANSSTSSFFSLSLDQTAALSIVEDKFFDEIIPPRIPCFVSISFNGEDLHEIQYPEFEWVKLKSFEIIQMMFKKVLDKFKESARDFEPSIETEDFYLRHSWCGVIGAINDSLSSPDSCIDDEEVMHQVAVRGIREFLHDFPFQKFELRLRRDYSFVHTDPVIFKSVDGSEVQEKFAETIRRQLTKKLDMASENIIGNKYISRGDLYELTKPKIVRRIIEEDDELPFPEKEDFEKEVFITPVDRLQSVCIYIGAPMTFLRHLIHDHKPSRRGRFLPREDYECHSEICRLYHQQFFENVHKFFALTITPDRGFNELDRREVMPVRFVQTGRRIIAQDPFSKVYEVAIDPSHYFLPGDPNSAFALQVFDESRKASDAFQRVLTLMLLLSQHPHDHILSHITSWTQNGRCYVLFEKPSSDLRQFMSNVEPPKLEGPVVWWFLRQLRGMADAIRHVHQLRKPLVTPFTEPIPGKTTQDSGVVIVAGRHHDIKPENIWIFERVKNQNPVLKIRDFRGAQISSVTQNLEATKGTSKAVGTLTYFGPESDKNMAAKISRPFDMWGLGCVFLEFLLWLLVPTPGDPDWFADSRLEYPSQEPNFVDDCFWYRNQNDEFLLKPGVEQALRTLETKFCVKMRAFLDVSMIVRELLKIDPKERLLAKDLVGSLDRVLIQAESDLDRDPALYLRQQYDNEFAAKLASIQELPEPMAES